MEERNNIIPPHLNAEVYRNETNTSDPMSYLDYIRLHTDGTTLIGCSELNGRYWNGAVKVLKSVNSDENIENKQTFTLPSGTADGYFLQHSDKVLVCQDSGALSIWNRGTGAWSKWEEEITVVEHDDAVLTVDCLDADNFYVTAGADGNIKIWDINSMICEVNYLAAHSMLITGVAVKPNSTNFASASLDRFISLWDQNSKDKVCDIIKLDAGVRCIEWLTEDQLLLGDEAGVVSLVDIRALNNLQSLISHPAPVHRITNQKGTNNVAVCCDNTTLSVYELGKDNKFQLRFKNNSHKNYVRGMAWDNGKLYTVGWDGALNNHSIPSNV